MISRVIGALAIGVVSLGLVGCQPMTDGSEGTTPTQNVSDESPTPTEAVSPTEEPGTATPEVTPTPTEETPTASWPEETPTPGEGTPDEGTPDPGETPTEGEDTPEPTPTADLWPKILKVTIIANAGECWVDDLYLTPGEEVVASFPVYSETETKGIDCKDDGAVVIGWTETSARVQRTSCPGPEKGWEEGSGYCVKVNYDPLYNPSLDYDGDGWQSEEGDCDDENDDVYPGAYEYCDGLDNDCHGGPDDRERCQD